MEGERYTDRDDQGADETNHSDPQTTQLQPLNPTANRTRHGGGNRQRHYEPEKNRQQSKSDIAGGPTRSQQVLRVPHNISQLLLVSGIHHSHSGWITIRGWIRMTICPA